MTFCVEGLTLRQELMFKAIVRLLDHSTHHQWQYHPASAYMRLDLLVVTEGVQPSFYTGPDQLQQPTLQIGAAGVSKQGLLSWPLQPTEIEKELNRLGDLIVSQRRMQAAMALPTKAEINVATTPDEGTLMRLQRWPPTKLLAGVGRMRMATLLAGKAMTLEELAHRSALSISLCQAFVDDLRQAKLLQMNAPPAKPMVVPPPAPTLPKTAQLSLLGRIRMRLGIERVVR